MKITMDAVSRIKKQIEEKIAHDQVILPTVPDSLIRIRTITNDDNASVTDIARELSADASLAARILKVSNSAAFHRNGTNIDNLQQAVTRLGSKLINTLVINHSLIQVFAKPQGIAGQWVDMIRNHSINVAAQAYSLAKHYTRLNPDDALLAGLMHNLGYFPLLQLSGELPGLDDVENPYWLALRELHTEIGAQLLQKWNFPEAIIKSAREHEDLTRNPSPMIELVDVIIVAQLTLAHTPQALAYSKVPQLLPAYTKLAALSPAMFSDNEQLKTDFVNAYQFLAA